MNLCILWNYEIIMKFTYEIYKWQKKICYTEFFVIVTVGIKIKKQADERKRQLKVDLTQNTLISWQEH